MKNGKMRKFLGNQSHDYEIVQDHLLDLFYFLRSPFRNNSSLFC